MAGRRIDDHSGFPGARGKEYPLPMGNKMKGFSSAEGSGAIKEYPDTTEGIHRDQMHADGKIKGRPMKTGYRY